MRETGLAARPPATETPGARMSSGTRVLASHGAFLNRYDFSPIAKPWSLVMTTTVFSSSPVRSSASSTTPICASANAVHARYARAKRARPASTPPYDSAIRRK
jgi:hypothetical protein